MIVFLRGTVAAKGLQSVDLDVQGVGYRVYVTEPHAASLRIDDVTLLYTYHHVREDAVQLFGFSSEMQRDGFELLIGVSGIGPKGALQILSGMNMSDLSRVIQSEDIEALVKLPGIGRKTAQRLIVELKEKMSKLAWIPEDGPAVAPPVATASAEPVERDAIEALVTLGYNEKQATEAVRHVYQEQSPSELSDLLRAALQWLSTNQNTSLYG